LKARADLVTRALGGAVGQQTATSEILRVISSSPTDLRPVFDAIVRNAVKLCAAAFGGLQRISGDQMTLDAQCGVSADEMAILQRDVFPLPITRESATGRAVVDRVVVHIHDIREDSQFGMRYRDLGRRLQTMQGFRTILAVPMIREGMPIGALALWRREVRPFTDMEIGLVQTFADQAVIAIENVRLFKELEARNGDLTATGEILQVISRSPTSVQPVFETIAANARRLCSAASSAVFTFDGELIHLAALDSMSSQATEVIRGAFPMPPGPGSTAARAIMTRRIATITEAREDSEYVLRNATEFRSILAVPMLREGHPIGAVSVGKPVPGPFPDEQVALLQTFADQAVIAIENVRLFTELQEKNQALTQAHAQVTESLEQQTATAEILRVISSSPTNVEAVFDTILANALRLCETPTGGIFTFDGQVFHLAAAAHWSDDFLAALRDVTILPGPETPLRRVGLSLQVSHVADIFSDPSFSPPEMYCLEGMRTALAVPMLKEGRLVGALTFHRREVRPFTEQQIALIKTFADQAVIAIENVRLFKELQARTAELTQSVEQLTALGEVSRAVTSTLDVETVLETVVSRARQLAGADGCLIYEYDEATEQFHVRATDNLAPDYVAALRGLPLRKGEGVSGRAAELREPVQVVDITTPAAYQSSVRDVTIRAGYRAALSVPLLREEEIIGSLILIRKMPGEFPPEIVEALRTFATQSALAIQNARLFHEIEDKGRQLEAASRHKSEFLANMSHELRTPLNAIIGFSEVLAERMFGELNEKQDEYLKDIYSSGQHLLSLINDILDLSKIEAGRMELEVTDFDLLAAIDNALILVRERASRRGIRLGQAIEDRVGMIRGDERKVKQVLLNLLSNALKFTPEGGRIDVRATLNDGMAEISVADTGVGIAPEDQEAIFEEFRQVGTADKKIEGTGLGLALSRKFIELHGGRIWVTSQVGDGSTFTFTLPACHEEEGGGEGERR